MSIPKTSLDTRLTLPRPLVYLAGPLFSAAELSFNEDLCRELEGVVDVYLPQRDGGRLVDLLAKGVSRDSAYETIFQRDVEAMRQCHALVLIMDGRTIDEGATFELGFCYALGKTCVGLQTDIRRLLPCGNNPMIEASLSCTYTSPQALLGWAEQFSKETSAFALSYF
jgi:nucleoside 2-deoxyribosyltransferase